MASINRVILVGNLTRDPELRHTPGGTAVCSIRLAVNSRKRGDDGQWVDKPNYFSVTVFGNQAEAAAQYLAKGRPVAIDGKLDWREWQAQDGGKRESVEIIAESVQYLGGAQRDGESGGQFVPAGGSSQLTGAAPDASPWKDDFSPSASDDDIPFLSIDRWGCAPVQSVRVHGTTTYMRLR